ncbi:Alpha-xylosidase BoGH31A [termite gut metagenome]|uniref:Alpha-xylosidase BoGH31A n=1 Tax=termite gut metagenome TaxID=433724 RepID=A0A5J4R7X5_9ZZZZ
MPIAADDVITESGKNRIVHRLGYRRTERGFVSYQFIEKYRLIIVISLNQGFVLYGFKVNNYGRSRRKPAIIYINDKPVLFYKLVTDETTFRSPVAEAVDYTVFAGFGDDVISSYRQLSGAAPMMPRWALGYIHCRERFKTQEELLSIARKFRERKLPMDLIVQDWLYWGKYGWNAMQFDETTFPDATQMVKDLHDINVRLMISVWSRVDTASAVGKQLTANGAYIPERDWVDFHNPEAAAIYWKSFNEGLVQPHQVDAWWQDATEPENDDLHNRWVNKGTIPGDKLRNTYPLFVNKTVYEGYRQDNPGKRTMILTRSAFSGMQRYGTATWSGDVSNDCFCFHKIILMLK